VAPRSPDLLTASQLAAFCEVDLKTIHNWAERGRMRFFRTPGRHLRFRRVDTLDFLRRYGYPIPEELLLGKPTIWDLSQCLGVEELEGLGRELDVKQARSLPRALIGLGSRPPDAVVMGAETAGMTATTLTRAIHESEPCRHVRVFIYTAREELRREVLEAGASALIGAPDVNALMRAVTSTLGIGR